jgi:FkbM family methyltransferase
MYKLNYFDIGANSGGHTLEYARLANVYSFEPNPDLYLQLLEKTKHLNNVHVYNYALSNYIGNSEFFIADGGDSGCSSLNKFSENSRTCWTGRNDFVVTRTCSVTVTTLKSFIEQNDIKHIDFIKIDAQGEDLRILEGAGKYIDIIKAGVIESANKKDVLYYNQNTTDDSINFLNSNGFSITKIEKNDHQNNESNIYFNNIIINKVG